MDNQQEDGKTEEKDTNVSEIMKSVASVNRSMEASRRGGVGGDDPSSSSSSNGRASGGGYSADCSSSDSSSDSSLNKKTNATGDISARVNNLVLEDGVTKNRSGSQHGSQLGHKHSSRSHHPTKENRHGHGASASLLTIAEGSAGHVSTQLNVLNDMIQQGKNLATTPLVPMGHTLPQWNGVRICNPMDPRIDLSAVNHVPGSNMPAGTTVAASGVHAAMSGGPPLSVNNYLHLMEAVSPFFASYGALSRNHMAPISNAGSVQAAQPPGADASENQLSSEGFTSFFTTTSDSNSGKENGRQGGSDYASSIARQPDLKDPPAGGPPEDDESDSSSMVVLARVKRKHLARQQQEAGSGASASSGPGEARMHEQAQQNQEQGRQPQGDSQSQNDQQAQHEGSGSSSSSSDPPPHIRPQGAAHIGNMPPNQPRVVSESSDAALARAGSSMTSSDPATNSATTTSGSGSGGNTGSGTGSGSNNGSSGSGDNQGSSGSGGEGKNSSGGENGSKEGVSWEKKTDPEGAPLQPLQVEPRAECHSSIASGGQAGMNVDKGAAREQKLMDKKRKRMNMRREYEEQIHKQQASSESSQSVEEVWLRPGKPVTLESVLSFTKIARVVTQGSPPFLVVHTNGAFTALTGIDSHAALGRPIGELLSIPDPKAALSSAQFNVAEGNPEDSLPSSKVGSAASGPNLAAAAAAGQARAHSGEQVELDMNVERLVAASGFGRLHFVNVIAQSHQMVGKNVTFVRDTSPAADAKNGVASAPMSNGRSGDEHGSNGSSIPSSDAPFLSIPCRMGVCPVVSAPGVGDSAISKSPAGEEISGKDGAGTNHHHHKRRKHHGPFHTHSHSRNGKAASGGGAVARTNLITHFVVQLERVFAQNDGSSKRASQESLSSKSLERDKTAGLAQQELRRPPEEEPEEETMDDATESTDPKEAVTAIG